MSVARGFGGDSRIGRAVSCAPAGSMSLAAAVVCSVGCGGGRSVFRERCSARGRSDAPPDSTAPAALRGSARLRRSGPCRRPGPRWSPTATGTWPRRLRRRPTSLRVASRCVARSFSSLLGSLRCSSPCDGFPTSSIVAGVAPPPPRVAPRCRGRARGMGTDGPHIVYRIRAPQAMTTSKWPSSRLRRLTPWVVCGGTPWTRGCSAPWRAYRTRPL